MFEKELKARIIQLGRIIEKITNELPQYPLGHLRIQKRYNSLQYYLVTDKSNPHGKFIRAENYELVAQLAQRSYYEKLLKEAIREQNAINAYLRSMKGKSPEDVFSEMNEYRKTLVEPLLISDADYAARWKAAPYEKNPYHPEECIYPTEKGDLVRSKTEARIADMYYSLDIPYRYEAPVTLRSGKLKYPDFTLLKMSERKIIYHEHLGIMEDEIYRKNNIIKLQEYSESGIFTANNLILTFETEYAAFNLKALKDNVKRIFS